MEPITLTVGGVIGLGVLGWAINHARNRPFRKDVPVFRASRWTKGNRIWPTQVAVFPKPGCALDAAAPRPFRGDHRDRPSRLGERGRRLIFGDVIIETTGGSQPIRCHGRRDAEEIRRGITEAQAGRQPKP